MASTISMLQLASGGLAAARGVLMVGYVVESSRAVARIEPSTSHAKIIIPAHGQLRIAAGRSAPVPAMGPFIVGAGASPVRSAHGGAVECAEIVLPPWGSRLLLGERVQAADGVVPLSDIPGGRARELCASMHLANEAGLSHLSVWIERMLQGEGWLPGREVAFVASRLKRSRGRVRISSLAGEIGWSERHLSARFSDATGIGPKR